MENSATGNYAVDWSKCLIFLLHIGEQIVITVCPINSTSFANGVFSALCIFVVLVMSLTLVFVKNRSLA